MELAYDVGIHVDMPAPASFPGDDGRRYLAYHALITNLLKHELVFSRIDILDAGSGMVIASLDSVGVGASWASDHRGLRRGGGTSLRMGGRSARTPREQWGLLLIGDGLPLLLIAGGIVRVGGRPHVGVREPTPGQVGRGVLGCEAEAA